MQSCRPLHPDCRSLHLAAPRLQVAAGLHAAVGGCQTQTTGIETQSVGSAESPGDTDIRHWPQPGRGQAQTGAQTEVTSKQGSLNVLTQGCDECNIIMA